MTTLRLPRISGTLGSRRCRATLAVLLVWGLAGCSGYFSGDWPDLSKGFDVPADQEESTGMGPADETSMAPAPSTPTPASARAAVLERLESLIVEIDAQKARYALARDRVATTAGDSRQRAVLTAQLELSRLSRLANAFAPLLAELENGGSEAEPLRAQIRARRDALTAFIAAEGGRL